MSKFVTCTTIQKPHSFQTVFEDEKTFEDRVLEKCEYLARVGLWPTRRKLDYINWINNFTDQEREYAYTILNNFIYFNADLFDETFKDCFTQAGQDTIDYSSELNPNDQWKHFFENCVVSPVSGEIPSLADSGYSFVRKSRDMFNIEDNRLKTPSEALSMRYSSWISGKPCKPIIFVDDFIGSGDQFRAMWREMHYILEMDWMCHEDMSLKDSSSQIYYCCPLSTTKGLSRLKEDCKNVKFCIGHVIDSSSSIFHPESIVWTGKTKQKALTILEDAADKYGMPKTEGIDPNDWKGYNEQGLLVGFQDSMPDATIGALRWNKNGWQPLIRN